MSQYEAKAYAPFKPYQIENLRYRQTFGHPYTCPAHSNEALQPGMDGMVCPVPGCGYLQLWVLSRDANEDQRVLGELLNSGQFR